MAKKYHCSRSYGGNGGGCEHGGNKRFNHGFVSGTSGYCWLNKRFLFAFSGCPKQDEAAIAAAESEVK